MTNTEIRKVQEAREYFRLLMEELKHDCITKGYPVSGSAVSFETVINQALTAYEDLLKDLEAGMVLVPSNITKDMADAGNSAFINELLNQTLDGTIAVGLKRANDYWAGAIKAAPQSHVSKVMEDMKNV